MLYEVITDHPSLDIVNSYGVELSGKRIVLCVSGSVAAYKAIELARLLMRHGADVKCVATPAVLKLVQSEYFKWATGNEVITKLTGDLEHIRLADYHRSDLIIVYPATANTLGKLANGIDDTPVSTVLTVGFRITSYNVCYTKLLRYYSSNSKSSYLILSCSINRNNFV